MILSAHRPTERRNKSGHRRDEKRIAPGVGVPRRPAGRWEPRAGTRDPLPGARARAGTVLALAPPRHQRCRARVTLGPSPVQRVKEWKDKHGLRGAAPAPIRAPRSLLSPPGQAAGRRQSHPLAAPGAGARSSPRGPARPRSVRALQSGLGAQAPRILCRRVGLRLSGYFCDSWSYRQIWQKLKKPKEQHTG